MATDQPERVRAHRAVVVRMHEQASHVHACREQHARVRLRSPLDLVHDERSAHALLARSLQLFAPVVPQTPSARQIRHRPGRPTSHLSSSIRLGLVRRSSLLALELVRVGGHDQPVSHTRRVVRARSFPLDLSDEQRSRRFRVQHRRVAAQRVRCGRAAKTWRIGANQRDKCRTKSMR